LLRVRWFVFGAVAAVVGAVYTAMRAPFSRKRLTGRAVHEVGMRSAAALLDAAAERVGSSGRR